MEETFKNIKKLRAHIKEMFLNLTAKKEIVNGYYIQYVEKNKKNKLFGLDSFHFQSKLIELEYKHLHDEYLFMDNRIYCDYYKLYGMVVAFCKQNFKSEYKFVSYPVYKDLDPYKIYDFETINNIHYNIIDIIQFIQNSIKNADDEINRDKGRLKTGLNLENYIHNLEYKNNILISNVQLYENYLNSYHIYHMNFLKKLSDKISLFWKQLSNNMQVNDETLSQEFKVNDTELKTADEFLKSEINETKETNEKNKTKQKNELLSEVREEFKEDEDDIFKKENNNMKFIEQPENVSDVSELKNNENENENKNENKNEIEIEKESENIINDLKVEIIEDEDEIIIQKNDLIEEEPRQRYIKDKRETEEKERENNHTKKELYIENESNDRTTQNSNVYISLESSLLEEPMIHNKINSLSSKYLKDNGIENKTENKNETQERGVKDDGENVHITHIFINNNNEIEPRDSAIERNAMIPEVSVENILNKDFIGIKDPIEKEDIIADNEKKKRRRKKK